MRWVYTILVSIMAFDMVEAFRRGGDWAEGEKRPGGTGPGAKSAPGVPTDPKEATAMPFPWLGTSVRVGPEEAGQALVTLDGEPWGTLYRRADVGDGAGRDTRFSAVLFRQSDGELFTTAGKSLGRFSQRIRDASNGDDAPYGFDPIMGAVVSIKRLRNESERARRIAT